MTTTDTGRAEARSRATRRLRTMTIGTALAAVAATGGLGWLAAVTDDGTPTTGATTIAVVGASGSIDTAAADTSNTSGTTSSGTVTAPTVRSASGGAVASTGGS